MRWLATLVATIGVSLLISSNAWAKTAQTITFTSTVPTGASAGGSYGVSTTETSGMPVSLVAEGSCSFAKPQPTPEERLGPEGGQEQLPERRESSATVYFTKVGICSIAASGSDDSEYEAPPDVSQYFPGLQGRS